MPEVVLIQSGFDGVQMSAVLDNETPFLFFRVGNPFQANEFVPVIPLLLAFFAIVRIDDLFKEAASLSAKQASRPISE